MRFFKRKVGEGTPPQSCVKCTGYFERLSPHYIVKVRPSEYGSRYNIPSTPSVEVTWFCDACVSRATLSLVLIDLRGNIIDELHFFRGEKDGFKVVDEETGENKYLGEIPRIISSKTTTQKKKLT